MFNRLVLEAQIRKLVQSLLHLVLDPVSEGFNSRAILYVVLLALLLYPRKKFFFVPSLKESRINSKLNSVVTRGYRLQVPFDVLVFLNLLYVVEVI